MSVTVTPEEAFQALHARIQQLEAQQQNNRGANHVAFFKPMKPNTFSGSHTRSSRVDGDQPRVDLWIFEMEQYFEATVMPEDKYVAFATSFLRGPAATWWHSHVLTAANSGGQIRRINVWAEFRQEIYGQFKPVNAEKIARDRLYHLRQHKSVLDYIYQFNLCCLDIPGITEAEKLDKFKRGLKPQVQRDIEIEDPQTLDEAMIKAQRLDSIYFRVQQKGRNFHRDQAIPMELDVVESGGDRRNKGQMTYQEKQRCTKERLCFNCKQSGHLSRNCPQRKPKQGKGQGQ